MTITTTTAPQDYLATTVCQLTPGTIPWGPGWFLIAANDRVEAGPFLTEDAALYAGDWLEDSCMGVHPAWELGTVYDDGQEYDGPPYQPRYSAVGLIVGSRVRDRGKKKGDTLAHAG